MKRKHFLSFCLLVPLLASCGGSGNIPITTEDYGHTLSMSGDEFKILQLTDIHWCLSTNIPRQKEYMDLLVEKTNPDFIVITGDSLFTATKNIASALYDYIDSLDIPYAVVYGNHDMQGMWSNAWMNENVVRENAAFSILNDEIPGFTNWYIDIEKDGETIWQLFGIDSNSYQQDGVSYDYDYIREEQVDWYESCVKEGVPSLGFIHIPLQEWKKAQEEDPDGIIGEMTEGNSPSSTPSAFFESAKNHNMKGIFCGHDHANDWNGVYEGVVLGYGVKCGKELYYGVSEDGYDITGAALYTIRSDKSFQIRHIYLDNDTFEFMGDVSWEDSAL